MSDFKAISILTEQIKATGLTTLERNSLTPATGHLIWNSEDLEFQYYDGSQWIAIANTNTTTDNMIDTFTVPSIGGTYLTPLAVGGVESTLSQSIAFDGQTYQTIIETLLYPVLEPTYTNPVNTLTYDGGSLFEVGETITKNFSATFDRGDIVTSYTHQDSDGNLQPTDYSGMPLSYILKTSANSILQTTTSSLLAITFSAETIVVTSGTNTYNLETSYLEGNQPYNSRGIAVSSPLPAGSLNTSASFYGTYPTYTNEGDTASSNNKLGLTQLGFTITFTISFTEGTNKHTFDIADLYGSVSAIQAWNSVAGAYQNLSLSSFTTSNITKTLHGNTVNYTSYVNNGPNRGSTQYRILF